MSNPALKGAAAALLVLHLALGWSLRAPGITLGGDDSSYLLLGRELGQGRYTSVWLAGAPPHGQYPPGYPAVLAVSGATAPGRAGIGVHLNLLLSVAALGVFTLLCWRWSPWATLGALGIAAVNLPLLKTASAINSEPLFSLLMFLALWCAVARPGRWPLALLAAIAAAFTRSIGVAVIAGLLIDWIWQRRWRRVAGLAIAAALTIGLWFVHIATVPQRLAGQSYIGDAMYGTGSAESEDGSVTAPQAARTLARRVFFNSARYVTRVIPGVMAIPTIPGTRIDNVVWVLLLLTLGIAGAVTVGRRHPVMPIVVACYFGILLVWPYVLWRFVVPVLPLLAFLVLEGARRLVQRWARIPPWAPVAGLAAVLVIAALASTGRQIRQLSHCDRSRAYESPGCFPPVHSAFFATVAEANRLARPGETILSTKPDAVYYLTGHPGVDHLYAGLLGPDRLDDYLRRNGVRFVLLRVHVPDPAIGIALRGRCREWRLVEDHEAEGSVLLSRREGADTMATTGSSCDVLARIDTMSP